MTLGILLIAIGGILMAVFGALGSKMIQEARTESANKIKDAIIENQEKLNEEVIQKNNLNKNEYLKETNELKDGQKKLNQGIQGLAENLNSKEIFSYEVKPYVYLSGSNQLNFQVHLENNSNIPGTEPKFRIYLHGKDLKGIGDPKLISYKYFYKWGESGESFPANPKLDLFEYFPFTYLTNSNFSKKILYPLDELSFSATSVPVTELAKVRYLIFQIDCFFAESRKITKYALIDLSVKNKSKNILEANELNLDGLIENYNNLLKN